MFVLELVSKPCDRNERMGKARHVRQSRGWCCLWTMVVPQQQQHNRSSGLGVQPFKPPYSVPAQNRSLASGKPLKLIKCEFSCSGSQWLRHDPSTGCAWPLPQDCTEQAEKPSASRGFSFHPSQTQHIFLLHPKASNSTYFRFKGTSWSCILYPAFSQPWRFLLPHGAPQAKQNFASPGRRTMRSPAPLQAAHVFYRLLLLKYHLNRGQSTGAHYVMAPPCIFLLLSVSNKYLHFLTTATLYTRSTRSFT